MRITVITPESDMRKKGEKTGMQGKGSMME